SGWKFLASAALACGEFAMPTAVAVSATTIAKMTIAAEDFEERPIMAVTLPRQLSGPDSYPRHTRHALSMCRAQHRPPRWTVQRRNQSSSPTGHRDPRQPG